MEKNIAIFDQVKMIYDSLSDEKSKSIFKHRLMYSISNDIQHISSMILELISREEYLSISYPYRSELSSKYNSQKKSVVLFGARMRGMDFCGVLKLWDIEVGCFCDNDSEKWGKMLCGLPIISPEILRKEKHDSLILISTGETVKKEIHKQLIAMNISEENIFDASDIEKFLCKNILEGQYFEEEILKPQKHEVFIDAGCFNGKTSLDFIKWCQNKYDKIYAFEPDYDCYKKCKDSFERNKIKNVNLLNIGLWSCENTLSFNSTSDGGSNINCTGTTDIQTASLDDILDGERVTFIKMDIEGAELEALIGSQITIRNHRPKLAISLYHKIEDILDIALYIKSLVPSYKLYLRHYGVSRYETVLYAIDN